MFGIDKIDVIFRVLCGLGAFLVIRKRAITVFYLSIRFCHDGTSTLDRIMNPQWHQGKKTTIMDKFDMTLYKLIPDARDNSDMGKEPMPYKLFENEKPFRYMRKTFLSTAISLSFYISGIMGVFQGKELDIFKWYLYAMMVFAFLSKFTKPYTSMNVFMRKRIRFLRLNLAEIIRYWSFGLFYPGTRVSWERVLIVVLLSCIGIVSIQLSKGVI